MNRSDGVTLDRLLEPVRACLTPEVAARIANLRAAPDVPTRLDELTAKNAAGEISADDRSELEAYVLAGNVIAILQAKARQHL